MRMCDWALIGKCDSPARFKLKIWSVGDLHTSPCEHIGHFCLSHALIESRPDEWPEHAIEWEALFSDA